MFGWFTSFAFFDRNFEKSSLKIREQERKSLHEIKNCCNRCNHRNSTNFYILPILIISELSFLFGFPWKILIHENIPVNFTATELKYRHMKIELREWHRGKNRPWVWDKNVRHGTCSGSLVLVMGALERSCVAPSSSRDRLVEPRTTYTPSN